MQILMQLEHLTKDVPFQQMIWVDFVVFSFIKVFVCITPVATVTLDVRKFPFKNNSFTLLSTCNTWYSRCQKIDIATLPRYQFNKFSIKLNPCGNASPNVIQRPFKVYFVQCQNHINTRSLTRVEIRLSRHVSRFQDLNRLFWTISCGGCYRKGSGGGIGWFYWLRWQWCGSGQDVTIRIPLMRTSRFRESTSHFFGMTTHVDLSCFFGLMVRYTRTPQGDICSSKSSLSPRVWIHRVDFSVAVGNVVVPWPFSLVRISCTYIVLCT